jgi:cysteinyl-tRNA synthetase
MESLFLYNSLTRKIEKFKPLKKGSVGMYTCGPTVYWDQHIGNLRAYLFSDVLKRTLLYNNYDVAQIINITDVGHLTSNADEGEDKMELGAKREGTTTQEIAQRYFDAFHTDLEKLHILEPTRWTKATDHIPEQIEMIKKLEKKGFTYRTSDGIYFDTSKLENYGVLAGIKKEGIKAGKRVRFGEKKNKTDFALWKFSVESGKRQQEWDSPWGVGFPGWHIECSAMAVKYLGENFDIHTGGEDHRQIHHPNEIAQSEAATGKKFVNYWMHGAFLVNLERKKISKSTGGLYTLSQLEEKGYKPEHYRYFCLLTHYRKPLQFSLENLDAAKNAFERVKKKVIELKNEKHRGNDAEKYEADFHKAVNDDLNIPRALQIFIKLVDDASIDTEKKIEMLEHMDSVLGLGVSEMKEEKIDIPEEVQKLVDSRERLRKNKMWVESDIIRRRILEKGYRMVDTPQGPRVEKL